MSNKPLISIIVPIYNDEKYLVKCIDSIKNQTLKNIEIILINDGSTDNCGTIIDEYAKQDSRIIAIHKGNGGQSSARNMGLDISTGKYIGFVDSDDWIYNDMYFNLYKSIEKYNADLCVCGREARSEDGKSTYKNELIDELIDFDKYDIKAYISNKLFYKHTVVVWNKIYKKEIIDMNNIRFKDVGYVGSEDALFNYEYLLHTNKIKSIDKIGYSQLFRCGSTATTYKQGYMTRTSNMIKCMNDYSLNINELTKYKEIAPMFLLFFYQWNMSNIKSVQNQDLNKLVTKELTEASYSDAFMKCVRSLGYSPKLNKYMKNMGFGISGIVFIKSIMSLYYLRRYKLTTKLILSK